MPSASTCRRNSPSPRTAFRTHGLVKHSRRWRRKTAGAFLLVDQFGAKIESEDPNERTAAKMEGVSGREMRHSTCPSTRGL